MTNMNRNLTKYTQPELAVDFRSGYPGQSLTQRQLTLGELLGTIVKRKWTILGFAALFFTLVAAYTFTRKPVYEGLTRLQIDPNRSTNLGLDDDKPASVETDSRVKTEIEIIQSETVASQVIDSLRLYSNANFAGRDRVNAEILGISQLTPLQRQHLIRNFKSNLTVKVVPNTEVVEIHFRNSDPSLAANVANSVITEYTKHNFMARVDGTAQVSQWLSKQLEEIQQSTTIAQQKLATFQKDNNLLGAGESDNIVTDRLKRLNEELTQAEADRIVKEGRYRLARAGNPELIDSTLSSSTLQVLRTQQAELQAQYSQLSGKFGSRYPKLHELQLQLTELDSEIKMERENIGQRIANEYSTAAKTESVIRSDFDQQKQQAYKLDEHVGQYAILKHEVESGQRLYDTLRLKLKAAGIALGLTSSYVNVIDHAQIPDTPVEPKKTLYLALGLGGGLFGGLLLGLIRDSIDDTVATSEELESIIAIPELGSVPFLPVLADRSHKELKRPFAPIALLEPNSPGVEAYRALCSVILLSSPDSPFKTLVVTSATSGEGKSTVSCNLATALAQRGRRVLLVDADLRCSSFGAVLGSRPGLSTMCANAESHPRYRPIVNLPNLHVIPAGIRPSDPSGLLDSVGMQEIMTVWRAEYDHVIVDTPPVLPFADALALAARADGVILVARSGVSRSKALMRARDVLLRSRSNLLGFVLNAVREREDYYDYPAGYEHVINDPS
jgi:polysaccharide biosynthesis transport protein